MSEVVASVLVPTTGDREASLRLSVESVLAQTVTDLEVLVIGDGAGDRSRSAIDELRDADERVRFFDFPKDESRGEVNRHRVLIEEARGRFVCYLCDRDLYLPGHVEELARVLGDADFGHTLRFRIDDHDRIRVPHRVDLRDPADRAGERAVAHVLPLSMTGHTLEMYRRLPFGWRETPRGPATDRYMWSQFLAERDCRVGSSPMPTVISFLREEGTRWDSPHKLQQLEAWSRRIQEPDFGSRLARDVWDEILRDRASVAWELWQKRGPAPARWLRGLLTEAQYARAWTIAQRVLPERVFRLLSRSG